MKQLLVNYTNYNHWANERVCNSLKSAETSLLDEEIESSFKSIRKTLYHIWDAETIWYSRLNGNSSTSWVSEKFNGSFDDFIGQFLTNSRLLNSYVNNKSYAELLATFEYSNTAGKKFSNMIANVLLHCVNHSTFHRGQIYTALRINGVTSLPSLDYITYIRENINEQ